MTNIRYELILFSIYIMASHSQEYLEYFGPPKCPQLLLNDWYDSTT